MIVEHWTESRNALVLIGAKAEVACVAAVLGVPLGAVSDVGPSKVALALWGADLHAYLRSAAAESASGKYTANTQAIVGANGRPAGALIQY